VPAAAAVIALGVVAERRSALAIPAAVVDLVAGIALVGGGVASLANGRARRSGALSLAAGLTWFAGDFLGPLVYAYRGPLAHLLVAHPTGRVRSWSGRAVVATAYVAGVAPSLGGAPWPTIGVAAATVAVVAAQCRHAPTAERGPRRRALAAAVATGGTLSAAAAARLLHIHADTALLCVYDLAVAATGAGLAWSRRGGLTGLVVDLGGHDERSGVRTALAGALGDPQLQLVYPIAPGRWVDESGEPFDPRGVPGRRVTVLGEPDAPVAALVHDMALTAEPRLLDAVAAVARLALANLRLRAEVAARVDEVMASRRRLVEAAQEERRRLGEEVEIVAGRRVAEVAARLRDATALAPLAAEAEAAHAQLRRFALGLHPRALSIGGLEAALAEQVSHSPLPVVVTVPSLRFSGAREAALFFVAAEALANVVKHAHASRAEVVVEATDAAVRLRVADDGVGGAEPVSGSGLSRLADRVEALGGTLAVDSPSGAGTRVEVALPLA
jgi:hypothetical protein